MAIKLPEDVELILKKKFPDVHIRVLVDNLFQLILEKTFKDGACTIKGFGKFISFTTMSNKIGNDVVRFKFKPSQSLIATIRNDEYLLRNLPVKAITPFNENNENNCSQFRELRNENLKAQKQATNISNQKTKEYILLNDVINMIHGEEEC